MKKLLAGAELGEGVVVCVAWLCCPVVAGSVGLPVGGATEDPALSQLSLHRVSSQIQNRRT